MTEAGKETGFPWSLFLSEVAGTALLVLGGLTCVILMFGEGSPLPRLLPDVGLRSAITGFLFGTTGALIALSPVGTVSGAHINPAVTFAFWLAGKVSMGTVGGLGDELLSRPVVRARAHLGAVGRLVDLLGRAAPRDVPGDARLQPPREANRGRQALPLRNRERPARAEGWLRAGADRGRGGRSSPRTSVTRPHEIEIAVSWRRLRRSSEAL
jgi:hypothetical protein